MSQAEQDERFMQRALKLAHDTIGQASPNPQVGCVLVQYGEIIAEGAHLYDLRDHAEIAALKQAAERGISTTGATAYVTLEPCAHHGRTGPCADALIAARIARCVIATTDPNPLVSGQGIAKLRAAGIEVAIGTLQQQARDLNEAFAHFIQRRKPFVTLKAALSADGKLAPLPAHRLPNQPHWLTGPAARLEVQLLRHASDAILTGIGTVLADNPALTDRTKLPRRRPLLRVILDTNLRTPLDSQLVRTAKDDLLILTGTHAPTQKIAALEAGGAEVLTIPSRRRPPQPPRRPHHPRQAQHPQRPPRSRLPPQRSIPHPGPRRQSRPLLRRIHPRRSSPPLRPRNRITPTLPAIPPPPHPNNHRPRHHDHRLHPQPLATLRLKKTRGTLLTAECGKPVSDFGHGF